MLPRRMFFLWMAILILQLGAFAPARADYYPEAGYFMQDLTRFELVNNTYGSFEPPTAEEFNIFYGAVQKLLNLNVAGAADDLDPLGYDVIHYHDTVGGTGYYYILREVDGARGLGTYVFNAGARRLLSFQAPHPIADEGTWRESVTAFRDTEAAFLQIAGTWRCVDTLPSSCSGTTEACIDGVGHYRRSDVAHYTQNFFQAASMAVHDAVPELVTISMHGFACGDPVGSQTTSLVQISNGTAVNLAGSMATQLAVVFNDILFSDPINFDYLGAGSHQWVPGEPEGMDAVGCVDFSGGTNVQGRYINGQIYFPCEEDPSFPLAEERFLHLEQQSSLRSPFENSWGISWNVTIDAINTFFEPVIWVDLEFGGLEEGSFFRPYATLGAAANAASPGQTIKVKASQGYEASVVNKQLMVESYGGSAVIGAPPVGEPLTARYRLK